MTRTISRNGKESRESLAIFGGKPLFDRKLHVGRPNIGDRDRLHERLDDILDRRWLTNDGTYVQRFEEQLAEYLEVDHCVALCNGTVALDLMVRALGLAGEVIVPSFTFVATVHCLEWQGIRPVFCDVDPVTHCIDPAAVERLITPDTTGILGVHVWGRACDASALQAIADRHDLRLIYDAAHALGSTFGGRKVGGFGNAECFSFHATKFVNSFEGGAITTGDPELADRLRLMRNFGFRDVDTVVALGINGKMHEVSAAMGLTSLESCESFIDVNRSNFDNYRAGLEPVPGIELYEYPRGEQTNFQYVVVVVDPARTGLSRDELVAILTAEHVLARRYFFPGVHRMEPYASLYPDAGDKLPVTERLSDRVLVLPTGTAVSADDIDSICRLIAWCVDQSGGIRERLERGDRDG